ncbi:hypothetical protein FRX31_013371 [Thalictrum thalictroides]|uniref:Uncharacterized protein n=1 Tax=Thalictrum thalictroides TaxID=46969 RepID=A0A7J6WI30_THATH|nr:hypothetical protein FRX31_013371 [Thalictrum thalictroides]
MYSKRVMRAAMTKNSNVGVHIGIKKLSRRNFAVQVLVKSDEDSDGNVKVRDHSSDEDLVRDFGDRVSRDEESADEADNSIKKSPSQANNEEIPRSDESHKSKRKGGFKQKMGIKDKSSGFPTQDGDNRDSNEGSSTDEEEEDSDPLTKDSKMSNKPRGLTNPTYVLDNSCKIKIIFNGKG